MGYSRAGFEVVGVDIKRQPHYPFPSWQADALTVARSLAPKGLVIKNQVWGREFDAIHASPPCQAYTAYGRRNGVKCENHWPLLVPVRRLLAESGLPYVIENVPGAPLIEPVQICGTGLGLDVQRHRLFESNFPLMGVPCSHGRHAPRFRQATNRANKRRTVEVGVWRIPLDVQQRAMGIDWMTLQELSEAIPPAYCEHVGGFLMREVEARRKVAA